ncbi:MAG: hypothetical protein SFU98_00140 [Leptospiraceae bacterium]|nr:hypothetical protein [Leptospiraceae bacterium]
MKTFSILILILWNCLPTESKVSLVNAQSQINAAVNFKAKSCRDECLKANPNNQTICPSGNPPQPPLFVFTDQMQRNLDFCSIAILRTNCPFDGYPIACIGIYYEQGTPNELPWYFNFNELAKNKFKP